MNKSYSYDSFLYGVVYYPEQWPEARWDADLAQIAQTGMNVVRMGEGAWSIWEPEEGRVHHLASRGRRRGGRFGCGFVHSVLQCLDFLFFCEDLFG
jgi:hypothetical protein